MENTIFNVTRECTSNYDSKKQYFKKEIDVFVVYVYIISAIIVCVALPVEHLSTALYYIAVILIAVMFAGLAQNSKTSFFFNLYLFLSFLVLFFTYGFRDFSAIDDGAYIRIFNNVLEVGWIEYFFNSTMEPGYLIINQIVGFITSDYLYMQLITSLIPLSLFYIGFKKYRNIISLPMAVFFLCTMLYFQMLSVALVRMFIGISIVFVAFDYVPKREPIKYVFSILLASMFHYSAFFLMFLTYFTINKENLSKKVTRTYLFLFFSSPFIFMIIATYLVPWLGKRYSNYSIVEGINISLSTFTTIPPLILLLLFYQKFEGKDQLYFKLFTIVYAVSIIISLFGSMVNLGRLIFYSYAAFILGVSMVGKLLEKDSKKLLFTGIMIPYGFLYVYVTQLTLDHHIPYLFPYKNLFFTL